MMKFLNLLIGSYILYYTINILLDIAKLKKNKPSTAKSQTVEFAISAPAAPQKMYHDSFNAENNTAHSAYEPAPAIEISKSNQPVKTENPVTAGQSKSASNEKIVPTAEVNMESVDNKPRTDILHAIDLEIISEGVEVTEEQLGYYAIPHQS